MSKPEPLRELAPPVVGKRGKQIDGQAIRRPVSGAAALEGGFLSLAGIREHYMAEEPEKGRFIIRHIETGKDVSISGIDYIQFADLTVSCAFLTRSNPENLVLPAPSAQQPSEQSNIHDLAKEVAAAIDEGLLAGAAAAGQASEEAAETIELGTAIEDAMVSDGRRREPADARAADARAADATAANNRVTDDQIAAETAAPGIITITEAELLAGAGDEAARLRIVGIVCRQDGHIEDNGDGSWSFHPAAAFNGEIALELTIRDGDGDESSVEAILTIEPDDAQDTAATAHNTSATEDAAPVIPAPQIAAEDAFAQMAQTIAEMPETAEAHPEPTIEAAIAEAPLEDSDGRDPVAPHAWASDAVPEPAPPQNQAPQNHAPQNHASQGRPEDLIVKVSELIGEDFEGQNVRLHDFTQPENGALVDNGDGTLSFTPNPGWDGSTTFTYSVIDEAGKVTSCTLIVELDPEDAPVGQAPAEGLPDAVLPADTPDEAAPDSAAVAEDLYAGARYEDIEVDEEDRPIGPGAEEMIAVTGDQHDPRDTPIEAATGNAASDIFEALKAETRNRPLGSSEETAAKPKKRSKNAEAAEALFKELNW